MSGGSVASARGSNSVLLALALATISGSFAQTIPIPIQTQLPEYLGAPMRDTAWVLTATILVGAVSTPIAGRLGDMYGRRRVLLALLSLLVAGSIICALSSSIVPMVIGRVFAGCAVGAMPLALGILRDLVPPSQIARTIGVMIATVGIGAALGLPISAFVAEQIDWHLLFVMNGLLAGAAIAMVLRLVPSAPGEPAGRLDLPGAVGLSLGLVGVLLAISRGNEWGWLDLRTLVLLACSALVFVAWALYELRIQNPMIDLRLFAQRSVLFTNIATIALGFSFFASSVVFPQLLQVPASIGGIGLTLQQASYVQMSLGIAILITSPIAGRVSARIGPRSVLLIGVAFLVLAYGFAVFQILHEVQVWHVAVAQTVVGMGIGCGLSAMPTLIFRAVDPSTSSAAAGLNQLMQSLGSTTAAAVVAAALAASAAAGGILGFPTSEGFAFALSFGLVACLICGFVALLIPRERA